MSTSKFFDKISIAIVAVMLLLTFLFLNGEKIGIHVMTAEEENGYFSQNDLDSDWDTSDATSILLSDEGSSINGSGAYMKDGNVYISYGGKYVLSGELSNGKVIVDAGGDDKVWLMMSDVSIHCEDSAALWIKKAGKVFLTLADGTQNMISSGKTYSDEAVNAGIDGVIYAKDDLTINGTGSLEVTTEYKHGIVCNDSLKISSGTITVSAAEDAIHANDCVCIQEATLQLNAGDDGITVSNDEQSDYLYIASGDIQIEECYEGLEATTVSIAGGNVEIKPTDDGINAEQLIDISGGLVKVINESGRDADGFDSNKDIVISGGKVFISVSQSHGSYALDYGSENQGECRIDGGVVIACGGNAMLEEISENSNQAYIMKTVSGDANTNLTLMSADGTELISETIPVDFAAVTLSTPDMHNEDICILTIGSESQEVTVDSTSVAGGMGGFEFGGKTGGRDRMNFGDNPKEGGFPPKSEGEDKMPNGDEQNMPEMDQGDWNPKQMNPGEFDFENLKPDNMNEKQMRPGQMERGKLQQEFDQEEKGGSEIWILVIASVVVLIFGLIFAGKKKY